MQKSLHGLEVKALEEPVKSLYTTVASVVHAQSSTIWSLGRIFT